jgi:hypothetical protein
MPVRPSPIATPAILAALALAPSALAEEKPSGENAASALLRPPENCAGELRLNYLLRTPQGHYLSKYEMLPNETCDRMLEKGEGDIEANVTDAPSGFVKRIYNINGDLNDIFFRLPRPGKNISVTYITMRPFNTEKLTLDLSKPGIYQKQKALGDEKAEERKKAKAATKDAAPKEGQKPGTAATPQPEKPGH